MKIVILSLRRISASFERLMSAEILRRGLLRMTNVSSPLLLTSQKTLPTSFWNRPERVQDDRPHPRCAWTSSRDSWKVLSRGWKLSRPSSNHSRRTFFCLGPRILGARTMRDRPAAPVGRHVTRNSGPRDRFRSSCARGHSRPHRRRRCAGWRVRARCPTHR